MEEVLLKLEVRGDAILAFAIMSCDKTDIPEITTLCQYYNRK
jgi:hypothetical protein